MQNDTPLVSICVPVYNHSKYVKECILSIVEQTYANIELIIIDDGSKDNSNKVIENLLKLCEEKFVRFKYVSRENMGLCYTLNEALKWVKGDYFYAIASDDILLNERTQKQVDLFRFLDDDIAILAHNIIPVDNLGNILNKIPDKGGKRVFSFLDILHGNHRIPTPATMIKTEILKKTNGYPEGFIAEDLFMWLSITKLGYKALYVDEPLVKYRVHDDNTNTKIRLMHADHISIIKFFSSNKSELDALTMSCNKTAFKGAVRFDRRYALKLVLQGKVSCLDSSLLFFVFRSCIPEKLKNILRKKY